jgi:hypothetical protein
LAYTYGAAADPLSLSLGGLAADLPSRDTANRLARTDSRTYTNTLEIRRYSETTLLRVRRRTGCTLASARREGEVGARLAAKDAARKGLLRAVVLDTAAGKSSFRLPAQHKQHKHTPTAHPTQLWPSSGK